MSVCAGEENQIVNPIVRLRINSSECSCGCVYIPQVVFNASNTRMDNFAMWSSPSNLMDGMSNDGLQMETLVELQDNGFEPQTRARSNTWPLPRPDNFVEPCDESESNKCSNQQLSGMLSADWRRPVP